MPIELVTFDAADTLLQVFWNPGRFAVECAVQCGLRIDEQVARERYERLLYGRWSAYQMVNKTRDEVACDDFWAVLTEDWVEGLGLPRGEAGAVISLAHKRLYGPEQEIFLLYPDVIPTVKELKNKGVRTAVISNWDYSLHRVLRWHDVYHHFDLVIASLEEGPEKPDPALFQIVLDRFGLTPDRVLHVGDNPLDDFQGAREIGMKALLLDRSVPSQGTRIQSLSEVLHHLE